MKLHPSLAALFVVAGAAAQVLPVVSGVDAQPLAVHVKRLRDALEHVGAPLPRRVAANLDRALELADGAELVRRVQQLLDPQCLIGVTINPESRVKADPGPVARDLVEGGWRQFLVKVHNQAGVTARLRATSAQARPLAGAPKTQVRDRWLGLQMFDNRPLARTLSGLPVEYRIVQLYSRDSGRRAAVLGFDVGQGTQDIGFRNDVTLTFTCAEATPLTLRVVDENGKPTTAGFLIRDRLGRVYPSQAKRLTPDFAFHPQVYRQDGEKVTLPPGTFVVRCTRGPEYLPVERAIEISGEPAEASFALRRWIDPAARGWWSGDHHIHAAGCQHYERPTEGVFAKDMALHCRGEDLKVGCNLTWGPCFDFQKQFFTGAIDAVSKFPYLLRYDVEVSGFGSHRAGHLVLLRLKQQMYPGGESKHHWPTVGLNTLRWAKKQGAVCGPAHSGLGLQTRSREVPTYEVPPFNGIGANEYIMQVTHRVPGPDGKRVPAVDFMSTVDTPPHQELNIWYHTLNAGFRTRISGETDFPCISGQRVGMGRSYVKLDKLGFDAWCEGVRLGKCYVSDGRSHLLDFAVGGVAVGTKNSELRIAEAGKVTVKADVAARLRPGDRPNWRGWHLGMAKRDNRGRVPVEVVVNGYPVATRWIAADGEMRSLSFDVPLARSSWVALRIYPSSHTNPVFVLVDGKPIRASRRSVRWCMQGLENCWRQKKRTYAADELKGAEADYEHARQVYRRILKECDVD